MILPTKRIPADRALVAIGADVLELLGRPQTVSKLWEETKRRRLARKSSTPLPFDWFVLSLSFLFTVRAIDFDDGLIFRAKPRQ